MNKDFTQKPIAALFDLDGVILDTESQYSVFWDSMGEKYLGKANSGTALKGMSLTYIYEVFFGNDKKITDEITKALNKFEAEMQMEYIAGARQFVESLKERDIKCAVVTSSNRQKMQSVYEQHPELPHLFDCILTAELFTRSKPNPDCYQLGATIFATDEKHSYVFEDSINGLKAGHAAKMKVVGLSTTNSRELVAPYSTIVIPDFTSFTVNDLLAL